MFTNDIIKSHQAFNLLQRSLQVAVTESVADDEVSIPEATTRVYVSVMDWIESQTTEIKFKPVPKPVWVPELHGIPFETDKKEV